MMEIATFRQRLWAAGRRPREAPVQALYGSITDLDLDQIALQVDRATALEQVPAGGTPAEASLLACRQAGQANSAGGAMSHPQFVGLPIAGKPLLSGHLATSM